MHASSTNQRHAAVAQLCITQLTPHPKPGKKDERAVKLFLAGMRWGVALPSGALRSRGELARSINDAFVGEVLSVGRGDDLSVVFVTEDGEAEEMPALRGAGGRRAGESASRWRRLAKQAARVYVRWQEGLGPAGGGVLVGGVHASLPGPAAAPGRHAALPLAHEELD